MMSFLKKEKNKLYIDFDGVIVDTIQVLDEKFIKDNIDLENSIMITSYIKNLNWEDLIKESSKIKGSVEAINKIIDNNLFEVNILTHINSLQELIAKNNFLKENINDYKSLNVIGVPKPLGKFAVIDPVDNYLVDDYSKNLIDWEKAGGIGIKFAKVENDKFITIRDLNELIE